MPNRERVIQGLNALYDSMNQNQCYTCSYEFVETVKEFGTTIISDAIELLKEREVRELTLDEWREWKNKKNRDPICMLWENDISPIWILNPNDVHEPALLMGKLKLFTGKPTHKQCKAVKWE